MCDWDWWKKQVKKKAHINNKEKLYAWALSRLYDNLQCYFQDSDLLLSTCKELLTIHLGQWQNAKFSEVEVAIALLYQLCEALPVSQTQLIYKTVHCNTAETCYTTESVGYTVK